MSNPLPTTYVCDDCGGEVQRRYSAWWYERGGGWDFRADCMESWCPACGEQVSASPSYEAAPEATPARPPDKSDPRLLDRLRELWHAEAICAQDMRELSCELGLPPTRLEELVIGPLKDMKPKNEEGK